jgi:hypothetical protein
MTCIVKRSEPFMLPGALSTFRRRCGKPNCRCVAGEPHESPALVFTEGGRTKTVTLAGDEVAEVEAAVARYAQARAELEAQAAAGVSALRARREQSRRGRAW